MQAAGEQYEKAIHHAPDQSLFQIGSISNAVERF